MFNVLPNTDWPMFRVGLQDQPPGFRIDNDGSVMDRATPGTLGPQALARPYGYAIQGAAAPTDVGPEGIDPSGN
jgi:hypothetical protein